MQTFLPYPDFAQSARVLDNKRLGKQRVECLQILTALSFGPYQSRETIAHQWKGCSYSEFVSLPKLNVRKTPWYNHPAVKMWRGWECTLYEYSGIICQEWKNRGFKDTCYDKLTELHYHNKGKYHLVTDMQQGHNEYYTSWLGNEQFHASHRSNLLRKDPVWYNKFGWTEPPTLEYVWPVS